MIKDIRPADFIAVVTIVGCLVLVGLGSNDPIVMTVLLTVVGFYFGRVSARGEVAPTKKNGNGPA